jgi:arginyl-tRNA synthetase
VFRKADEKNIAVDLNTVDPSALSSEQEKELIVFLSTFPDVVMQSGEEYATQKITNYLETLAAFYHKWYASSTILTSNSRLVLNAAVGQVIKIGLGLLGVSAPERM